MSNRPAKILLYLAFMVNVFLFGSSWMFNKMVLQEGASPIWGAAIRQSIAAVVFLIVYAIRRPSFKLSKRHWILVFLYGILMLSLAHIFVFIGQKHLYSGLSSIIFSFFPLAIVAISAILIPKKEPLTVRKILGTLIGLIGIVILFYTKGIIEPGTSITLGVVLIVLSVFVNAVPNVIIKRDGAGLDPLIMNTGGMLIASLILIPTAFIFEGVPTFALTKRLIFAELYLGIFCSSIAFFLYFWMLRYVSVFKLSLAAYMTPLVAVFLGYVFYNEILSLNHYIGMLLIFMGIFITELRMKNKDLGRG